MAACRWVNDLVAIAHTSPELVMTLVNTGLNGHLAWRQHDGGHTDAPNWQHFLPWATRLLNTPSQE